MSYHSIQEEVRLFIKEHSLPFRSNCPICGHKNTFGAALLDGHIIYNCFHGSCNIKGRLDYGISLSDIRSNSILDSSNLYRIKSTSAITTNSPSLEFQIPDYWGNVLQNERCRNFLKRWNLLELYASKKIHLFHDPKMDRCVFLLIDKKGVIKGAVGRNLTFPTKLRWFVYSILDGCPFIQHRRTEAILVEDAISACAASVICSSISILGTSISEATIPYLLDYSPVYIALDKDATSRSVKLQKQLAPYVDARILPLQKDLKYYSKLELETLQKEILNVSKR